MSDSEFATFRRILPRDLYQHLVDREESVAAALGYPKHWRDMEIDSDHIAQKYLGRLARIWELIAESDRRSEQVLRETVAEWLKAGK